MNWGKAIYNILTNDATVTSLVGTKIYQNVVSQTTAKPYVRFSFPSSVELHSKDEHEVSEPSVQVDCFASDELSAWSIADAVTDALDRYSGTANGITVKMIFFEGTESTYNDKSETHVITADFKMFVDTSFLEGEALINSVADHWYISTEGVTTSGFPVSVVTQWDDQIGTNHLTRAATSAVTPGITFDNGSFSFTTNIPNNTEYTMIAVVSKVASDDTILLVVGNGVEMFLLLDGQIRQRQPDKETLFREDGDTVTTSDTIVVTKGELNKHGYLRINGTEQVIDTISDRSQNFVYDTLGGSGQFVLKELIIAKSLLTDAEIARIESYESNKYDI